MNDTSKLIVKPINYKSFYAWTRSEVWMPPETAFANIEKEPWHLQFWRYILWLACTPPPQGNLVQPCSEALFSLYWWQVKGFHKEVRGVIIYTGPCTVTGVNIQWTGSADIPWPDWLCQYIMLSVGGHWFGERQEAWILQQVNKFDVTCKANANYMLAGSLHGYCMR